MSKKYRCVILYKVIMASFDLNVDKNTKEVSKRSKAWGVILLVLSLAVFLLTILGVPEFVRNFVLGVLGLSIYPILAGVFCVGLALLSDRHYFLPIKYLVYLMITAICVLALINVVILGNPEGDFAEYLALTYNFKYTAGGVLAGVIAVPLIKTIGLLGAVIVLVVVICVFMALIIDFLRSIKKYGIKKVAAKKSTFKVIEVEKPAKKTKAPQIEEVVEATEEFNLFLDKKLEEEENRAALLKLGLIEGTIDSAKKPEEEKKSIREHLLTPPKLEETFLAQNLFKNNKPKVVEENHSLIKTPKNFFDNENFELQEEYVPPEPPPEMEEYQPDYSSLPPLKEFSKPKQTTIKPVSEFFGNKPLQQTQFVKQNSGYVFPPLSLLENHSVDLSTLNENVIGKRALLEETLQTFGINARVKGVVIGPSVTRYEIEMPHGVSVKRILSLEDDISLALASRAGIRIEAPIPGKSAVGIEVPNESIATVSLREVLETEEFKTNKSPVTFALGKNISGNCELCNLAKMPHILVAGATNSGKSICLNAIIISMIYKSSPEDLRLILIDPKRVEFSLYNDLPHLLIPNVITEVDKAVNALLWCVNEMERRFELLQMARCRNSEEYNHSRDVREGTAPKMPYIVVIVDELADLMSSGKKELEEYLRRLTQKARAAGILLVLATQRPSVDVITGVIKTNCPARISFALTSQVDSRTILDCAGAESLLGRGDMLYRPSDAPSPRRVQGCFVSAEEVERVVEFVKANTTTDFDDKAKEEIEKPLATYNANQIEPSIADPKWDPLLPQALKMFIENGQASTSAIQRRFLAGFPRASRIVDQLCQMGYLSQPEGTKPRTVLITMEEFYEKFGRDFE